MSIAKLRFVSGDLVPFEFWSTVRSDLRCWNEGEVFRGVPFSFPIARRDGNTWLVKGVFCHPACVKRYLIERKEFSTLLLFEQLLAECYGWQEEVFAAPKVELLSKFSLTGSGFTIVEYRSQRKTLVDDDTYPVVNFEMLRSNVFEVTGGESGLHSVDKRGQHPCKILKHETKTSFDVAAKSAKHGHNGTDQKPPSTLQGPQSFHNLGTNVLSSTGLTGKKTLRNFLTQTRGDDVEVILDTYAR